ncbi:MAG: succinylglutamate desuccinylase/aspartoacylase family protein [Balneolaceae bacterium]
MRDIITINGHSIGLGESADINLNIAKLPTHTTIDLPVRIVRSHNKGPVLLLTGGLHGDEINGIEIIRRIVNEKMDYFDIGTIIAIPLVNVYGFIQNVRGVPDGKDINRSFPGNKTGSLANLVAYTLMTEIIPHIDFGIDYHTGGASRANYPQVRCTFEIEKNVELAKAFHPPVLLHSSLIDKSFRKAAFKKGKHILVFESGESLRYDEFGIDLAVDGTLRLMKSLGMISNAPKANYEMEIFKKSKWIRARNAGLFKPRIELGETVKRRQMLGRITDPFGHENFKIISKEQGKIIGLNNNPVIHKGDALMHLAVNE